MPLSVVVRSAAHSSTGGESPTLTFDGSRVVIGRGGGCDVRLPDPSVSHRHASVRTNGAEYLLVDEGSTNGTFVGGVKLAAHTPRALRSGDLVRVGRVWLEVRVDQATPTRELASATRDVALALVADAMAAMGDDVVPKVRVVEGRDRGATLALAEEGRVYLVGRDEECDLPLGDEDASREHVHVVRRGSAVLLRDLDSKNGVLLGEGRLPPDRDTPWRSQLMVRVGHTVLALDDPVAAALASLEMVDDEPIGEGDPIPPPPSPHEPPGPPASPAGTAAPITAPAPILGARATVDTRRGGWSGTDVAVVIAALGVIAMSIAGLYWLLRG
jgi:pSer/pThr/pTyr-binding forkhead associated (FHA) protein